MGKMSQIHAMAQQQTALAPEDPGFDEEVQTIAGEILALYAEQAQLEKALVRIEYGNDFAYSTQRKEIDAVQRRLHGVKKEIRTLGLRDSKTSCGYVGCTECDPENAYHPAWC